MNKPTDAELDEILDSPGNINWVIADRRERWRLFARAVLARWGQPAHSGEPILYDPKALFEVFQNAQAGSSGTAGTLRGIAAVIASWESRTEPHTWLIAAPQVEREPLTPEAQVFEALRGVDSLDALAVWRAAEQYHNIKGGPHADT